MWIAMILFCLILLTIACVEAVCLFLVWGRIVRLSKAELETDRMWNRIEWLCKDTDDRLSVDRMEFQQKSKQIAHLWKRLRYVEKRLYIEPSDAFKEKEDGE